jgi:hypothetical protein
MLLLPWIKTNAAMPSGSEFIPDHGASKKFLCFRSRTHDILNTSKVLGLCGNIIKDYNKINVGHFWVKYHSVLGAAITVNIVTTSAETFLLYVSFSTTVFSQLKSNRAEMQPIHWIEPGFSVLKKVRLSDTEK